MVDILTFEAVLAEALVLVLCGSHAVAAVQAGPAVAGAVVHAAAHPPALREAVGQVQLLVVDGDLSEREGEALTGNLHVWHLH